MVRQTAAPNKFRTLRRDAACERHTLATAAAATAERGAPAPSCRHGPSRDPSVGLELARRGLPSHRRGVLWHPTYAAPTAVLVPADVVGSDLAGLDTLRHDVGSRYTARAAPLRARVHCCGRQSALAAHGVQTGRCRSRGWRRRGQCVAGRERRRRDVSIVPLGVAWLAAVVENLPPKCGCCCCCCAQWARSLPADAAAVQSWSGCPGQAHPTEAWGALPMRLGAAVARVPADAARRSCRRLAILPAFRNQGGRPGGSGRSTEAPLWVGRRMKRVPARLASYDLWQRSPPGGQTCSLDCGRRRGRSASVCA